MRLGDRFNPILVKETRQALKSRQFVVTFSTLLFAALGWTIVGSLSMMPQIYITPSAPRMLIGYYVVLAVPMMLVVPLAAYRSLENEIDDGTLELLTITTLSPQQMVLGKLASAMLQMLLYFVALFPCVAYAYNLRGVDLPTTIMVIAVVLLAAITLTVAALFLAPLAKSRSGRIVTLLILLSMLLLAQWGLGTLATVWILQGGLFVTVELLLGTLVLFVVAAALCHLLLICAAAQLTPASENRSTGIRVALLIFSAVTLFAVHLWFRGAVSAGREVVNMFSVLTFSVAGLGVLWLVAGSMMAAEADRVTSRIRRELPSSFFARAALNLLTPGPVTGVMLAAIAGSALAIGYAAFVDSIIAKKSLPMYAVGDARAFRRTLLIAAPYGVLFLVGVRWLMAMIRLRNQTRVEVGMAALVTLMVVSALVPYSVGLHVNDYRPYTYSAWQSSNWAWTLSQTFGGTNALVPIRTGLSIAAAVSLLVTFFAAPQLVFPRRIALPRRVAIAEQESTEKV